MTGKTSIHDFAVEQTNRLLTTLAYQVHRAVKKPGPDEIHDLRVSVTCGFDCPDIGIANVAAFLGNLGSKCDSSTRLSIRGGTLPI